MLFRGEWLAGSDGVARPIIRLHVTRPDGTQFVAPFLVDSGADATIFSHDVLLQLGVPTAPGSAGTLQGVGGQTACIVVQSTLTFTQEDSNTGSFTGNFGSFLSPDASEISLLGRDVLNNFEVIISYRLRCVLFLTLPHAWLVGTA